jgi:hypothetical protein
MRKATALLLVLMVALTTVSVPSFASGVFDSGDGSEGSPYIVKTAAQLTAFADSVNGGETYSGKHIELGGDIALTGQWTPIGTSTVNFAGTLDGGGYTVSGLAIGTESAPAQIANAGFFDTLANTARVENLRLAGVAIYAEFSADRARAGGLAAQTEAGSVTGGAVIDNCHVSGTVVSAKTASDQISYAAGLVAQPGTYMSATNSGTDISVVARAGGSKAPYAGGLYAVGGNNSMTANCYALGDVAAFTPHVNPNSGVFAAGLVGMQSGKVYNCYASGDITVTGISDQNSGTAFTAVAALSGQLIKTTGGMNTVYYNSGAKVVVNNVQANPTPAVGTGTPTASKQPENVTAYTAAEIASATLTNALNSGARSVGTADIEVSPAAVRQGIALPDGVSLHDWEISGGAVIPKAAASTGGDGGDTGSIFASGSGTESDPYMIDTEEQLRAFATSLTDDFGYEGKHVKLGADIALADGDWVPIGEGEYAFCGSFDGGGHTVSGLKYESAAAAEDTLFVGFFGVLNGTAKNLKLANADIKAVSKYNVYAGVVAGYIDKATGIIDGVRADGKVYSETKESGNNFAGGIVGSNLRGYILNTGADVDVSSIQHSDSWAEVGGITSMNNRGYIMNCYSLGDVYAYAKRELEAGIAASNLVGFQAGTVANCYAAGDLETSDWAQAVGAVAGNTTGIGKGYFLYYNKDAQQNIGGQRPNPIAGVGITVKTPDEDNPSIIISGFNHEVKGQSAGFMKSESLATLLNDNLQKFPVQLPENFTLKKWRLDGDRVVHADEDAVVNYVPVTVIDDTPPEFFAGDYEGRSSDKSTLVKIRTTVDSLSSITLVSPSAVAGSAELIAQIIANPNNITTIETATPALVALKSAIDTAIKKAKLGDATGYGAANPAIFAGGAGTEQNPYRISTETQLRAFAAAINADESFSGKHIAITGDIALTKEWIPAGGGQGTHSFKGVLDGKGHTVKGMRIGSEASPSGYRFAGLIGYADGVKIKDLNLTQVSINNVYAGADRAFAGTVVGGVDSMSWIDGCTASGDIKSVTTGPQACFVGGISAFTSGYGNVETGEPEGSYSVVVTNCGTDVTIYGQSHNGWVYAGGIIGNTNRTYIVNSYSIGDITAYSGNEEKQNINRAAAGGISGMSAGRVANCYTLGNMRSVTASTDVGGYAGRHTGIAITENVYYNNDASHQSGQTALSPTPGVGYTVPASTGEAPSLTAKAAADMKSAGFAATLNSNLKTLTIKIPGNVALRQWSYDAKAGIVTIAKPPTDKTGINAVSIASAQVAPVADKAWTGRQITPAPAVKLNGKTLKAGTDYTLSYGANEAIGKGSIKVTGKGSYAGTKTVTFKIVPKKIAKLKAKAGKKNIKLTWKKASKAQGIAGYQIQYRVKGNGKWKAKTVSAKKAALTLKGLKPGKAYQFKIRAYKPFGSEKYCSAWSKLLVSKKVKR